MPMPEGIAHLYPSLNAEKLAAARENLERYLALVVEIWRMRERNPQDAAWTPGRPAFKIHTERSNLEKHNHQDP
jgi:hypothetical protein